MGDNISDRSRPAALFLALLLLSGVLPFFSAGEPARGAVASRGGPEGAWPAFHGNAARDGNCTEPGPVTNSLLWSNNTGANCYGSPAVAGKRVFVGSTDGTVYCFNSTTGVRLWTFATGGRIHSTPWVEIEADRLFFGSHDNYVYCLNATSGAQVWRTQLGGVVTSSALVHNGRVYVGCGDWYYGTPDGYLYCLYASNGSQAWRAPNSGGSCSPALSDGRLFSIGDDGLVCLDPETGTRLWSNSTVGFGFSSASIADGRVFTATMGGHVLCFNASDGTELWDKATGWSESSTTPAISNGSVYVCVNGGNPNGGLVKLDAADGAIAWSLGLQGNPWSSPVVAGENVYFANARTVACVKGSDHSQVWSYTGAAGDMYGIGGSPAIAYGRLYIGGAEAKLYCIGQAEPNRPPAAVALAAPANINETAMTLNWSRNADADFARYELHASKLQGFAPSALTLVSPDGSVADSNRLSLRVRNLEHTTHYYFKLRVWDDGVPPMYNDSNEVDGTTLTPNGAPRAVRLHPAEDITPCSVRLSWTASNDTDFDRYEVHRSLLKTFSPTAASLAATVRAVDENSTTVSGLKPWTTYYLKVRVCDNGAPALYSDSNLLEVLTGNTAPAAVALDPPRMGATSADLGWSASADDDFAAYEVHFSQDQDFIPSNATRAAAITSRPTTDHTITGLQLARTYYFMVRVVDQGGMINDSERFSGLTANTLPRPVISSPSDGDLFDTRTPVVFDCSGSSDQDLDPLSFYWTSSVDGYLSSNATFTRLLSEGSHRISVFADDGHGHNASARLSVTVNKAPNRRPSVSVASPSDNAQVSGVVTFSGKASDIDGNETLRAVEVKIGKADWDEAGGVLDWSYSWNTTKAANGKVKALFRAFDGTDYSPEVAVNVVVNNIPINLRPAVAIAGPSAGRLSKTAVITGTASDPDGQIIRVEVSLNGGGWQAVLGRTAWSFTLDTAELRNGNHFLQVRSFDGTDYSEPARLDFTVGNASPPAASGPGLLIPTAIAAIIGIALVAAVLVMRRKNGHG